jgi:hypothetical protein
MDDDDNGIRKSTQKVAKECANIMRKIEGGIE